MAAEENSRLDFNPRYKISLFLIINLIIGFQFGLANLYVKSLSSGIGLDPLGYAFSSLIISLPFAIISFFIQSRFSKKAKEYNKVIKGIMILKHSIVWVIVINVFMIVLHSK